MELLILAGTTEARELAEALGGDDRWAVTSSFAGATSRRQDRPGATRVGGFGGVDGLVDYFTHSSTQCVVDATHPFAAHMPHHVAAAARTAGIARCRLLRPAWHATAGDVWHRVGSIADVGDALADLGAERTLLATGRQSARALADVPGFFVIRSIEPLDAAPADHVHVVARPPFTVDDEIALLREHQIDAVVAKNAGGGATVAKLDAARTLGIPVVMIERPPQPEGPTVSSVDEALVWLAGCSIG